MSTEELIRRGHEIAAEHELGSRRRRTISLPRSAAMLLIGTPDLRAEAAFDSQKASRSRLTTVPKPER